MSTVQKGPGRWRTHAIAVSIIGIIGIITLVAGLGAVWDAWNARDLYEAACAVSPISADCLDGPPDIGRFVGPALTILAGVVLLIAGDRWRHHEDVPAREHRSTGDQ